MTDIAKIAAQAEFLTTLRRRIRLATGALEFAEIGLVISDSPEVLALPPHAQNELRVQLRERMSDVLRA